jgi:hypothetical protein
MTSVLGLMLLAIVIAVVLAVLIVGRMRPPGGAARKEERETDEYAKLYGEEPVRRKVRAVAKVDSEKVDVEPPVGDVPPTTVTPAPDYVAAAAAAGFEVEEPEETSEPPLPSWMSATKAGEVQLEEKAVEPPPATPPEWSAPPAPEQAARTYGYRKPEGDKQMAYKGAGRPK